MLSKIHQSIRFVDNSYHPGRCSELRICSLNLKNFPGSPLNPRCGGPQRGPITPSGADDPFHFCLPSDAPVMRRYLPTSCIQCTLHDVKRQNHVSFQCAGSQALSAVTFELHVPLGFGTNPNPLEQIRFGIGMCVHEQALHHTREHL